MERNELILYVADQEKASAFYEATLGLSPALEVPGMTEFDLGGVTLGLMPAEDMATMIEGIQKGHGQRCELYLRRSDATGILLRAEAAGGTILSEVSPRPWGESVGYALDVDGHVLAVAQAADQL